MTLAGPDLGTKSYSVPVWIEAETILLWLGFASEAPFASLAFYYAALSLDVLVSPGFPNPSFRALGYALIEEIGLSLVEW